MMRWHRSFIRKLCVVLVTQLFLHSCVSIRQSTAEPADESGRERWAEPGIDGGSQAKLMTFELQPVAAEEHFKRRRKRRRLLNANESSATLDNQPSSAPLHWFGRKNAVYATIPEPDDPFFAGDADLLEFYRFRHLSRYERRHRVKNGLDLQLKWDGIYRFDEQENDGGGVPFFPVDGTAKPFNRSRNRRTRAIRSGVVDLNESSNATTAEIHEGGRFNNYQAVPLSQGYGTHFANVWVGSPVPQRKTVIVDTGSHYTAFPCVGCVGCGAPHHTDPYYDPSNSATSHQLLCDECRDGVMCDGGKCKFSQSYTEGSSWEAVQVQDRIFCGGSEIMDSVNPNDEKYSLRFMFGCIFKMSGLFVTQLADGIMGMSAHPATLPKKLHEAGLIEHNMFAMCFRRELGTSKRGVTAGSMTFGGVSNNLDTTPIVYAKNLAKVGWYTVYVKNIYVRVGGGQSANSVDNQHRTIKVVIDRATLNSGKGVIVDSGTTDTYLHKNVAKEFNKAWTQATGQAYSHQPISLTTEQLHSLPTVLIQCMAENSQLDPSIGDYASIPGYAGKLDQYSPNDLLIAIPATSYMDYSPITKKYMSRLYFTETAGGVLGSNTMQGHNVVFDWEHGRVGFAESSCTYDKKKVPPSALDEGYLTDCQVGDPVLSQPCVDSVDKEMCRHNPSNIALLGNEIWSAVVESPGNNEGISCAEAAEAGHREGDFDSPVTTCDGTGVCQESRTCQLTCPQLAKAEKVEPLSLLEQTRCGDTFWSACDYGCYQTRILTVAHSDGHCHEVGRETRICHTGACARSDPCRVPYLVHAVFGFGGGDVSKWTPVAEAKLVNALVNTAATLSRQGLFVAGDIHVLAALPWSSVDADAAVPPDDPSIVDEKSGDLGIKVVVEISIYNSNMDIQNVSVAIEEDTRPGSFSFTFRNITDQLRGLNDKSTCHSRDLYDSAKQALEIRNDIMGNRQFFSTLLRELEDATSTEIWPFGTGESGSLISAWTVRTTIDQDDEVNYFGPRKSFVMRLFTFLHGATLVCTAVLLLMASWSFVAAVIDMVVGTSEGNPWRLPRWDRRQHEYSAIAVEDENTVEASILMGQSQPQSRSSGSKNRLKKRIRSPNSGA